MDWEEWSESSSQYKRQYARHVRRQAAAGKQAQTLRVLAATRQSPVSRTQDYRIHMLLSTLMLIAALLIANMR